MTTRAAIYCRISRDAEGQGLGVARQERDCRELCARRGWEVEGVYVDNDVSATRKAGRTLQRPEFERMLGRLGREAEAVVAWDLDRVGRDPLVVEQFWLACERAGVRAVATIGDSVDVATGEGLLVARIKAAVAAEEARKIRVRVARKHLELAERGELSGGGTRPFGYLPDRRTVCPEEAALVREAAGRVLAGDSVRSVALDWRARGVRTVTGADWSPTTIKRMLCSGRLSGQREHRGEIVGPAAWGAILAPEETLRLRAVLRDPSRRPGRAPSRYLLGGLVRCGREGCGARMSVRPTATGARRYICPPDRGGCGRVGVDAEGAEAVVVESVLLALESPEVLGRLGAPRREEGPGAAEAVAAGEARLLELADLWDRGEISRAEWQMLRGRAEARLDAARAELRREGARPLLPPEGADVRGLWEGMTFERRRALLGAVVDRVVVLPFLKSRGKFDPERVRVEWRA
jgi:site-specific DNA recombinase